MENLNIWEGLLITFVVLTIAKIVLYRFDPNRKTFRRTFFTADSWMDYVIHLAVTWAFFYFEHDLLNWVNPLLEGFKVQIPHPENKGFLFILIPILVSTIGYKLARRLISKPIQEKLAKSELMKKVAPHIHDEFCKH
jgi:hypothetical protein